MTYCADEVAGCGPVDSPPGQFSAWRFVRGFLLRHAHGPCADRESLPGEASCAIVAVVNGSTRTDRFLAATLAICALLWTGHFALTPMSETDLFFHLKFGD